MGTGYEYGKDGMVNNTVISDISGTDRKSPGPRILES